MPEQCYFTSSNQLKSKQTQGTDARRIERTGMCVAASAIWCDHMIKGVRPLLSKPDMGRAQLLQVRYRWGTGRSAGVIELLGKINLNGDVKPTVHRVTAMRSMIKHPGVYHICASGHAFAEDTRDGHHYHYDVEKGLYGYDDSAEWTKGVNARVPLAVIRWDCILCHT